MHDLIAVLITFGFVVTLEVTALLESTKDGNLGEGFFLDLLRRGFTEDEARQQLKIAVDWGRYGELFDFDSNTGQLSLDHNHDLRG